MTGQWGFMKKYRINETAKLFVFDLETSNLDANRGHILCAAGKWVGAKPIYTWRIDETPGYGSTPASFVDDSELVRGLTPYLEEADAVIAYYGSGFDVPYFNTRAIINKLPPPAPFTVIDPWKTARSRLKLARNSMDSVAAAYQTPHQKQHLPWDDWLRAQYGDKKAIDKLLKYNVNDVVVLEEIYLRMRPLIKDHPYVGTAVAGSSRCPSCGSARVKGDGYRRTRKFEVKRGRCSDCGTCFELGRKAIK